MLDPALPRYPSIVHAFWAAVKEVPGSLALVCRERRLSYAELAGHVRSLAADLEARGMAGRCVAIALPSGVEAVVAILAVMSVRAQAALLNPFFTLHELDVVLSEARPALVISGPEARDKLQALSAASGLELLSGSSGASAGQVSTELIAPGAPRQERFPEPLATDRALLIFTGGTTGQPKAVVHDHASLMVSVLQHCSVWPVRRGGERFLSVAPVFHIWGLAYATFVPLYCQSTLVIVPRYEPEDVLKTLETERITVFGGGPAPVYMGLMRSPSYTTTDFSSLTYCLSGGAPCPEELHREWEALTRCPLLEGWGMSEAAPLCLNPPQLHKPLSVGLPVPETDVQVVELERGEQVLPAGQAGEVRVRGPQLMLGYHERPDATREVLRDGWLYTGDIGYLDAEGYLFLVDRKKDMIIVGGYNVYPRQVDEVLFQHPDVAEAATVGRADPLLGEALVAFVVPKAGRSLDPDGVLDFCREHLVKYRRPVEVYVVDALPRTNARKIDKKALRARLGEEVQSKGV
jgi:long-chain acyl-CoA synthetase